MMCHKKNYGKKWIQLLCRKFEERSKIFFYRLPKLHKISNSFLPLWPIVSSFNSFTFIWLLLKIQEYTKKNQNLIKGTKNFRKTFHISKLFQTTALHEKCPYSKVFWSVFFRICTEYLVTVDSIIHILWNFLKTIFHKIYLVHTSILCPKFP